MSFLVAGAAAALSDGYQPLSFGAAMHPGRAVCVNLRVVDAGATHFHQRGEGRLRHSVGENCQVLDGGEAALVVDPHGHQGHAGANVLKRQVEALAVEVANLTHLCVQLHLPLAQVALREALISSDSVNLGVAVLAGHTQKVPVRFDIQEVEGLLAGARYPRNTVAVTQRELELHKNALAAAPRHPAGLQPVVLLRWLHHVAHLVRPDGLVLLIHTTYLLPLERETVDMEGKYEERDNKEKKTMKTKVTQQNK